MKKLSFLFALCLGMVLNSCFDDADDSRLGGVIITTNTSPSARVYVYAQGDPVHPLDSQQTTNGRFGFTNLPAGQIYVLWADIDSLRGAWLATTTTTKELQLQEQNYRWLSLDSNQSRILGSAVRGYFGLRSLTSKGGVLPVLNGSEPQVWIGSADARLELVVQGDSARVQINKDAVFNLPLNASTGSQVFVDTRDGNQYALVTIGSQVWFKKNLRYIPPSQSYCPDNDASLCTTHGRLYPWAITSSLCPVGFHLPDSTEMAELVNFCGGLTYAGTSLRSSVWAGGADGCGFAALPAGFFDTLGTPNNVGTQTSFWLRSKSVTGVPHKLDLSTSSTYARILTGDSREAWSVRCLRD